MKQSFESLKNKVAKNDGVTFFQQNEQKVKKDPVGFYASFTDARNNAIGNYKGFINDVKTPSSPSHDRAMKKFKDDYGFSEDNAYRDFMKDVPVVQDHMYNPSREQNLVTKYPATSGGYPTQSTYRYNTSMDQAMLDKLKGYVKSYVDANGYKGVCDAISEFWKENAPLSQFSSVPYNHAVGAHPAESPKV